MYRKALYIFSLFILQPNFVFASEENNYEYEYIQPKKPVEEVIINPQEEIENFSQYKGDHNKKWYKKTKKERNKYINFAINYSFANDLDVISDNVFYPTANDSAINVGYLGKIDRKGGLGIDLAYGFELNKLIDFEVETHYTRSYVNKFIKTKINSKSLGSPTYTEEGPKNPEKEDDEVLTSLSATANIILNFPGEKFSPYIGGGYGIGIIGISSDYNEHEVIVAKLGLNYILNYKMKFYLQIKQLMFDRVKYSYNTSQTETNTAYNDKKYYFEHYFDETILSIGYKFNF